MILLALLLLLPLRLAHADENDDSKGKVIDKPVLADTAETFAKQTEWIENDEGGRYEFRPARDRQRMHEL